MYDINSGACLFSRSYIAYIFSRILSFAELLQGDIASRSEGYRSSLASLTNIHNAFRHKELECRLKVPHQRLTAMKTRLPASSQWKSLGPTVLQRQLVVLVAARSHWAWLPQRRRTRLSSRIDTTVHRLPAVELRFRSRLRNRTSSTSKPAYVLRASPCCLTCQVHVTSIQLVDSAPVRHHAGSLQPLSFWLPGRWVSQTTYGDASPYSIVTRLCTARCRTAVTMA